jgi:hypothetical protein
MMIVDRSTVYTTLHYGNVFDQFVETNAITNLLHSVETNAVANVLSGATSGWHVEHGRFMKHDRVLIVVNNVWIKRGDDFD